MANYDLTYEGSRVQGILDTGDELRDAGYIFRGEATPSTVPGTPTERVAYIGGPGTYTNFGSSITVGAGCICVFKYTGSAWSNQVINTGLSAAISSEAESRANADGLLQNAISAINAQIGNGYVYAGVATPSTSPVTGKVFYLAITAGTYTNFEDSEETPLAVTAGINILKNTGTGWVLDQVIAIDAEPTQGSDNLVKSGGVLNSIIQNGPAFDLSAYNAEGGVLATYADIDAALTALNALPADFKKGGMSMKFVLSSDNTSGNKYIQARCMAQNFTTDVTQWQGVDDTPTAGSNNLIKSGGVKDLVGIKGFIEWEDGVIANGNGGRISPSTTEKATPDFYFIQKDTIIQMNLRCGGGRCTYVFYDAPATGTVHIIESSTQDQENTKWTAPSNGYLRFSNKTGTLENPSVEVISPSVDNLQTRMTSAESIITQDHSDVVKLKASTQYGVLVSKGYINIDTTNNNFIVSQNLYFNINGEAKSLAAGTYANSYSGTGNFVNLVVDFSSDTPAILLKEYNVPINNLTQKIIATITRTVNKWDNVVASSIEIQIDGVSSKTIIANLENQNKTNFLNAVLSRGYVDIVTETNKVVVSDTIYAKTNGTQANIPAGTYDYDWGVSGNFKFLVWDKVNSKFDFTDYASDRNYNFIYLAGLTRTSQGILNHVVCSSMDVRLNGVSQETIVNDLDNRVQTLENEINQLEAFKRAIYYDTTTQLRELTLRQLFEQGTEPAHWYGIDWTEEENANNVTAIYSEGDSALHTTLPIQNKMRRCIVKDKEVVYYLDANNSELKEDGTAAKLDGTDGNVMVEIPEFFYKHEQETVNGVVHHKLKLSEQGLPGFLYMPKRYTSAYECTINRTTDKFVSVCTTVFNRATEDVKTTGEGSYIAGNAYSLGTHKTAMRTGSYTSNATNYRGGINDSTLDSATDPSSTNFERNQLGIPADRLVPNDLLSHVDLDNNEFPWLYDTYRALWMFCLVEYKNRNIQATELGIGATNCLYDPYIQYYSQDGHGLSALPCGITNSLGNTSGFVYYKQQNVPTTYTNSELGDYEDYWVPCMSYRGVEHFYGHLYDLLEQIRFDMEWVGGQDPSQQYGKYYSDITYYYWKNPFEINFKAAKNLGKYRYIADITICKNLLLGDDMHILPIDVYNEPYDPDKYFKYYADCVELSGGWYKNKFLRMNGRTVSGELCGLGFFSSQKNDENDINGCARLDILI